MTDLPTRIKEANGLRATLVSVDFAPGDGGNPRASISVPSGFRWAAGDVVIVPLTGGPEIKQPSPEAERLRGIELIVLRALQSPDNNRFLTMVDELEAADFWPTRISDQERDT